MSSPHTEAGSDARRMLRLGMGFVLFQLAWFACVIGAARGEPWIGIAAVALMVALALAVSTNRRADLRLIAVALLLGVAWDSLLARTGIVQYRSPRPLSGWAPRRVPLRRSAGCAGDDRRRLGTDVSDIDRDRSTARPQIA
ncbi:MAG: DUF2878 domain-containing protein [Burkholderiales bacterium]|nr:DUF2878 domain-containing protein [Burkholderiales bacterium]